MSSEAKPMAPAKKIIHPIFDKVLVRRGLAYDIAMLYVND